MKKSKQARNLNLILSWTSPVKLLTMIHQHQMSRNRVTPLMRMHLMRAWNMTTVIKTN